MVERQRQIIAFGGGGFSKEADNPALERYVLEQARTARPAISFLGTASGDADPYIVKFYSAFTQLDCRPSHLSLFQRTPELKSYLLSQDVIYVGGGNTKSMLAVWRDWGIPELLTGAWEAGVVLAGSSAGAICWFEQGLTDSLASHFGVLDCLGFLPGSCCPHYDSEAERQPAYHELLSKGEISAGYAIEDGVAMHFLDRELHRVISSRPDAKAYRLHAPHGSVKEEPLAVEYIGKT